MLSFIADGYFVPKISRKDFLIIGFCISFLSTAGDLIESFLKRAAKVKDSGDFFPGHGGFLDRVFL